MQNYKSIVVLTGAGISAESGIQTFRASDGLWAQYRIEEVATPEGFAQNPSLVQQFYNQRRHQLQNSKVQANAAHFALAKLEKELSGDVLIVTQNIDNLHEESGAKNLLHMHGELMKMRCSKSGNIFSISGDITSEMTCSCCAKTSTLRPHVVWFGEAPLHMDIIESALMDCDLFISIGTSGQVYPAAGFVRTAKYNGAHTIEVNLEPSEVESDFDEHLYGKAATLVPQLINRILNI